MARSAASRSLGARLALALGLAYFQRGATAWILAWPAVYAAGASGLLEFPSGDALLFGPGGALLLEVLGDQARGLFAAYRAYWPLPILALALGVVPQWLLFRACRVPSIVDQTERSRELARFAALGLSFWVARAFALLLAVLASALAATIAASSRDERSADLAVLAVLALGGLAVGALSLLHDASRAALIHERQGLRSAIARGARVLRERFALLGGAYAASSAASVVVVLGTASLVRASSLSFSAGLHQLAVIGVLVVRAGWIWMVMNATRSHGGVRAITPVARPVESSGPG